ncbi:MAG: JmjC domain-containing protein [Plesiomonas sp.]|uniref:ribosomal protein uL16 3-hydroxylase n=1 Tax=Plesiomonas sp. TaxID=2486279 RepID=UPI003F335967
MPYQLNIDWPAFMATYWQKKPVILRGAFTDFIDPMSADELAGIATEPEADSRIVSFKNQQWNAQHGPFESYDHLGETHWSLLVQSVNHWHPLAAKLITPFRVLPNWRLDDLMVSFSTPHGGVGPHIDQYGVFIIQGSGLRRWRVGDKLPLQQHCPHPSLLHVEKFEPIIDEELNPGDILYIPPGFPHDGDSIETSMSFSVGYRAPDQRDLISSFADHVLAHDLGNRRYDDPDLALTSTPGEITVAETDKIHRMMLDLLSDKTHFNNWFGSFISQSRHELDLVEAEPEFTPDDLYEMLQSGLTLQRLGGLRAFYLGERCFINGEELLLPKGSEETRRVLCDLEVFSADELGEHLNNATFMTLLTELVNTGYWYFEDISGEEFDDSEFDDDAE